MPCGKRSGSFSMRRKVAAIFLALSASFAQAEFMRDVHQALSVHDPQDVFHLQLSGLIDAETYFIDGPAPGLLFTDDDILFNPRLTLYLDAQIGPRVYLFVQARLDRGFDPAD